MKKLRIIFYGLIAFVPVEEDGRKKLRALLVNSFKHEHVNGHMMAAHYPFLRINQDFIENGPNLEPSLALYRDGGKENIYLLHDKKGEIRVKVDPGQDGVEFYRSVHKHANRPCISHDDVIREEIERMYHPQPLRCRDPEHTYDEQKKDTTWLIRMDEVNPGYTLARDAYSEAKSIAWLELPHGVFSTHELEGENRPGADRVYRIVSGRETVIAKRMAIEIETDEASITLADGSEISLSHNGSNEIEVIIGNLPLHDVLDLLGPAMFNSNIDHFRLFGKIFENTSDASNGAPFGTPVRIIPLHLAGSGECPQINGGSTGGGS